MSTGSGAISYSQRFQVKCEAGPHGAILRSTIHTAVDTTPDGPGPRRIRTIDDGTWLTEIDDVAKSYSRKPRVPESVFALFASVMGKFRNLSRVTVATAGPSNNQVYVISANVPGGRAQMRVSKLTGEVLGAHVSVQRNGQSTVFDVAYRNQIFNKPVPRDAFVWTAPVGYKEKPVPSGG